MFCKSPGHLSYPEDLRQSEEVRQAGHVRLGGVSPPWQDGQRFPFAGRDKCNERFFVARACVLPQLSIQHAGKGKKTC